MVLPQNIDLFAPKAVQETKITKVGIFLTILFPIALGAYLANSMIGEKAAPPVVDAETVTAESKMFTADFMCLAQDGCFVTLNYSNGSASCAAAIRDAISKEKEKTGESTTNIEDYFNKCKTMKSGDIATLPFCYTSDPIDGPSFSWKRNQLCDPTKATAKTAVAPPNSDCRVGVMIRANFLQYSTGEWDVKNVPLFAGVHILNMNEITEDLSAEASASATETFTQFQALPVHSSGETYIQDTNICCSQLGGTCASNGNPGTVNDHFDIVAGSYAAGSHYTVRIRTFPNYNSITVTRANWFLNSIIKTGSMYNVFFVIFSSFALMYRLISGAGNEEPNNSTKPSAPAKEVDRRESTEPAVDRSSALV